MKSKLHVKTSYTHTIHATTRIAILFIKVKRLHRLIETYHANLQTLSAGLPGNYFCVLQILILLTSPNFENSPAYCTQANFQGLAKLQHCSVRLPQL